MFKILLPRRASRRTFLAGGILSASLALGALPPAQAASLSWGAAGGGGAGTWDLSTANWFNGTSAQAWSDTTGTTDIAAFAGTAGAVTLGTNLGALGLVFSTTGYTIAGANTLTLGASGIDASALTTGTTTISAPLSLAAAQPWAVGTGATLAVSGIVGGTGGFTKSGAGTLTLSGANVYSGGSTLNAGTVSVGNSSALGTGTLTLNGGTLQNSGNFTISNNVVVGGGGGTIKLGINQNLTLSGTLSGSGNLTIGGSTQLASIFLNFSSNTATGTITIPNSTANNQTVVRFNTATAGSATAAWVIGGAQDRGTSLEFANATIDFGSLSGTGLIQGDVAGTRTLSVGALGTDATFGGRILNGLSGGTVAVTKVGAGKWTLTGANAYTDATTVNAGTLQIGNGTTGSVSSSTAVSVSSGATLAFNQATGATFSNVIANAGTVQGVQGSGITNTLSGVISGTGGVTQNGAGTMNLSGANTYTGGTTVSAGMLQIGDTGDINASSGITINGSGAKFLQTSSTAGVAPITLTQGTLDGTGEVGAVTVGNGTGGIVTNGNGGTSTLTIASLAFGGAGTINLNKASDTSTPALAITGAFTTTPANGQISLNFLTSPTIWTNGSTYNLISYGSFTGANANFTLGAVPGLGGRQSATLGNTGAGSGFITLAIAGDTPVWTGAANANWTTTAQPSPFNWKLQTAGTGTQFLTNDQVLFNDTATGTTAINIANASVSPVSMVFSNSTKNYSISSSGGFGIATGFLIKSGTGSLTLNTSNTYSGGTTLNDGALNINNASAIGSGALTITTGTIDNTSGSAVTLSTNNAQFWNGDFTFGGSNDLNLGTGAVTLASTLFLTTNGTATLTVGGVISGGTGVGIFKEGPGTLTLGGANTFDGGVIIDAGTLRIGNAAALGTSTNSLTFGSSSGAKLQVNGNALTVRGIDGDNTATIENSNATNGTLTVNATFGSSFDGTIQDGSAGTLALSKSGTGTLTLTGANTYSGGTTLNAGTLSVGGASALGTGTVTVNGGTISSAAAATLSNAFALNGGITFNAASGDIALGGAVSGTTTNVIFIGAGTTTLSGTNTFTAGANFAGLVVGGGGATAGNVSITGSTTVDGTGFTDSRGILDVHGNSTLTIQTGGSLTVNGSSGVGTNSIVGQNATGTSTLQVNGGSLSISGADGFVIGNNRADATGVLTISLGTATIAAGNTTLHDPRNMIAMGRDGATGMVNLDGGTLATGRQFVRDGSSGGTAGSGTATFNFNGGTLQAQANQTQGTGWFETATTGNFQVVTTNVLEGGAKIDTNGFNVNIKTALVHSGGSAIDGGLTKNGAGILSLGGANTFTGNVAVNAGTLSLATNVSLDDTIVLSLAPNTTLDLAFASGSETINGLVLNGTVVADGTYTSTDLNTLGSSSSISFTSSGGTLTVLSAVPEPGTVAMTILGLGVVLFGMRRRRHIA